MSTDGASNALERSTNETSKESSLGGLRVIDRVAALDGPGVALGTTSGDGGSSDEGSQGRSNEESGFGEHLR